MVWVLYILLALFVLFALGMLLLGRGERITRSRLGRLARIGRLSARLSTSWLGARLRRLFASREARARYDEARRQRDAAAVAQTMGQMKGAMMKLGQMVSFITDAVPAEYRRALESLQAQAPPMDFPLLRDVAERELGMPLERAFSRFDERPLAAASIGQVHRARLPDGTDVAVKIQYPGVGEAIRSDLRNAGMLYRMVGMMYPGLEPGPVVEELRSRIGEELDYTNEARNQRAFYDLYRDHPFIRVPRVIDSHSTKFVLTTELVEGRRFQEVITDDEASRNRAAEIIYRFVFGSIIRWGVFNGDPHPGNYLFDKDGNVIFLDFGCVKYFPEPMLRDWRELVRNHFRGNKENFRRYAAKMGFFKESVPFDADLIYDYFSFFYEPFRADRVFQFSREYNARSLSMVFKPDGKFAGMTRQMNMPPDFVFVNRIQWGVYSILSQLGASGNWHKIHRELIFGDPPSTDLGRLDEEHRRAWLASRGFGNQDLILRQDGVRPREPRAMTAA